MRVQHWIEGSEMAAPDRRKEARYITSGIRAHVGAEPCPIVDISRSAVRVLRPEQSLASDSKHRLRFEIEEHPVHGAISFAVDGVIVRQTDRHVVFRYQAPIARWEHIIKSMDIFADMSIRPLF